ncbi:MAG: diacylglycerol kinase [Nitratiruptor sp.]|nr:diacylglycerol kinase [Nitratiruptor sp.]NPA83610.1 diacylglycerol kinase [Campylobacterota bacterium]
MHNKPRYHLFHNARYALEGLLQVFIKERSFQIEVLLFLLLSLGLWLAPVSLLSKVILQTSLFIPLIAELFNSAIEGVVDLITQERHPLAKYAKDAGAAGVLLSLLVTLGIWVGVCIFEFFSL